MNLACPKARRDLTISTLIAECEEYVQTDEFTKDLSDKLVHLFSQNKNSNPSVPTNPDNTEPSVANSNEVILKSEKLTKPPKIPDNMRTKNFNKTEKTDKAVTPKFPVHVRSSTYDNVTTNDSEIEDEGIDNDYDEADDSTPTNTLTPATCSACDKHESSPALTSEGYDSAQESGNF